MSYNPGPNSANYSDCAVWNGNNGIVTTVGSNGGPSYYGTYDQNGNVWEWVTTTIPQSIRRGGNWRGSSLTSSDTRIIDSTTNIGAGGFGFRVASLTNPLGLSFFVSIGDINNNSNIEPNGLYGSVSYEYKISQYTITNCEYTNFLNAIAKTDTYGVYRSIMGDDSRAGIIRSGTNGNYNYQIKPNMANKPVVYINWFNAARYCNWLHNGKPTSYQNLTSTEDGAYSLYGIKSGNSVIKNNNAKYWIPTEDEWYKAAYYSPIKNGINAPGYWLFATQNDSQPICVNSTITGDGPYNSNFNYCVQETFTSTPTPTPTITPTITSSINFIPTPTITPIITSTPTPTLTPTITSTITSSITLTNTPTITVTPTSTKPIILFPPVIFINNNNLGVYNPNDLIINIQTQVSNDNGVTWKDLSLLHNIPIDGSIYYNNINTKSYYRSRAIYGNIISVWSEYQLFTPTQTPSLNKIKSDCSECYIIPTPTPTISMTSKVCINIIKSDVDNIISVTAPITNNQKLHFDINNCNKLKSNCSIFCSPTPSKSFSINLTPTPTPTKTSIVTPTMTRSVPVDEFYSCYDGICRAVKEMGYFGFGVWLDPYCNNNCPTPTPTITPTIYASSSSSDNTVTPTVTATVTTLIESPTPTPGLSPTPNVTPSLSVVNCTYPTLNINTASGTGATFIPYFDTINNSTYTMWGINVIDIVGGSGYIEGSLLDITSNYPYNTTVAPSAILHLAHSEPIVSGYITDINNKQIPVQITLSSNNNNPETWGVSNIIQPTGSGFIFPWVGDVSYCSSLPVTLLTNDIEVISATAVAYPEIIEPTNIISLNNNSTGVGFEANLSFSLTVDNDIMLCGKPCFVPTGVSIIQPGSGYSIGDTIWLIPEDGANSEYSAGDAEYTITNVDVSGGITELSEPTINLYFAKLTGKIDNIQINNSGEYYGLNTSGIPSTIEILNSGEYTCLFATPTPTITPTITPTKTPTPTITITPTISVSPIS